MIDWQRIVNQVDWRNVGHWGPGVHGNSARLARIQCLFIATRLLGAESEDDAPFAFMAGSNRYLGGSSPTSHIAQNSFHQFEDVLTAIERYLSRSW